MEFLADLHIHSRFSRATSKEITPENLWIWSRLKGVALVGTGDFTQPVWFAELREMLVEAEEGLFKLRNEVEQKAMKSIPESCSSIVRFVLSTEISSIYKKNGRVRKIHNVVLMPSFDASARFSARLAKLGNIASDGRPILGLDARNLLELALECSSDAIFIPAHIWTPWFSLFGANSGFDFIEECFEDLTGEIFALETGLSSDPQMNRMLSRLDMFTLVSNSDAHSCDRIGREANIFDCELTYSAIRYALKNGYPARFKGTIEFFPEEGKYHFDGHRRCGARMAPEETLKLKGMCRVCGKPVTVGVMNRVYQLSDRKKVESVPFYRMLIPLKEVIGDAMGTGASTKGVDEIYNKLLKAVGPEIFILKDAPIDAIEAASNPAVSYAVQKMREWKVKIEEGYDGEFGKVSILTEEERAELSGRLLFEGFEGKPDERSVSRVREKVHAGRGFSLFDQTEEPAQESRGCVATPEEILDGLDEDQKKAVLHEGSPLLIVAGPGTGKTKTLTSRVAYRIGTGKIQPEECLAVTFTNKAAEEMRSRLLRMLPAQKATLIRICTFHSFGLAILREYHGAAGLPPDFRVVDPVEQFELLSELNKKHCWNLAKREIAGLIGIFDRTKNRLFYTEMSAEDRERFRIYTEQLLAWGAVDFGDLIVKCIKLLEGNSDILNGYREKFKSISVDEYQDINPAQHRLLMLLSANCNDLLAIGDPDQSIYGFRGSSPEFFTRFSSDFPGAKTIRLRTTYRNTEIITTASQNLLGISGMLVPQKMGGRRIIVHTALSEKAEAEFIVKTIEKLVGGVSHFSIDSGRVAHGEAGAGKTGFADIVVLFRMFELSSAIKEALDRRGIPYQVVGEKKAAISPEESLDDYDPHADRVTLMTMHAAKGLEYKAVFIVGCEDGIIPLTIKEVCNEDEERRLFYVAMTRAKEALFISHARRRMLFGKLLEQRMSRYVSYIDEILKEEDSFRPSGVKREKQLSLF